MKRRCRFEGCNRFVGKGKKFCCREHYFKWKEDNRKVRLKNGYYVIWNGEQYQYLHRLLMELYLGRELSHNEIVHHINNDKLDNSINNLQVLSISAHAMLTFGTYDYTDPILAKGDSVMYLFIENQLFGK